MKLKRVFCFVSFVFLFVSIFSLLYAGSVKVKGYYKSNGTYVAPHYRNSPNGTVQDNWSYKSNVNPYTGKVGTNYYRDNPTSEYYTPGKIPDYTTPINKIRQDTVPDTSPDLNQLNIKENPISLNGGILNNNSNYQGNALPLITSNNQSKNSVEKLFSSDLIKTENANQGSDFYKIQEMFR